MSTAHLSARALEHLLGVWQDGGTAYSALAARIRLLIIDGRIAPGTRLPAERELAARLRLSRSTVRSALRLLRERGYLQVTQGSGSVAALPATGDATALTGPSAPQEDTLLNFSSAALPAFSGVADALHRAVAEAVPYLATNGYDPVGLPVLRRAIAARYEALGVPTSPEEILVTVGAQHALSLLTRTLLRRGDRVVVEAPTYPHALDALRSAGGRLLGVPVTPGEGWAEEELLAAITDAKPALIYLVPDFQNPTNECMPVAMREAVVRAAHLAGSLVIADETTGEMATDPSRQLLPLAIFGDAISVGSAGKLFWGGLRVGWIRGPVPLIRRLVQSRPAIDLGTPVIEQLAVAHLLGDPSRVAQERALEVAEAHRRLTRLLAEHLPAWSSPEPEGGLSQWVNLGRPQSSQLALRARDRGLVITAGPRFGLDGAFERYLRIPVTYPAEQTAAAVRILAECWHSLESSPTADAQWLIADVV